MKSTKIGGRGIDPVLMLLTTKIILMMMIMMIVIMMMAMMMIIRIVVSLVIEVMKIGTKNAPHPYCH